MNICDETAAPLLVPRLLYGSSRGQSHRQWKSIAKKAAKTGSWDAALAGIEFMPLSDVQGDFSRSNAHSLLFEGDNLWLDGTFDALWNTTADRACHSDDPDAWAKLLESLTVSGLDQFWFALCLCVTGVDLIMWRDLGERRRTATLCLPKLLHWWPQLCRYDLRFSHGQRSGMRGWPLWSGGLALLCRDLGVHRVEIHNRFLLGSDASAKAAAEWLDESMKT